jgi:aryl-alcohol dehydrogenase-like predicted oxidoreductase
MTFGRESDEETSFAIMDTFVERGFTFIDTANAYSRGGSETVVGKWLKERRNRQDVVIATKVYGRMGEGPNEAGLARIHIHQAVEASLRRLQTDVIDLYQIHRWDPTVPPEETAGALNDLVRQGKVRYIGCSNLAAWQIAKYLQIADRRHYSRFVSLQPIYNALNRAVEAELLPLCDAEGIGVLSYNPLGGGFLTGKYRRGQDLPEHTRLADNTNYFQRYHHEQAFDVAERFVAHAKERGITPAQLALAWVLGEPRVTCPILGARTVEQLEDSLGGFDVELSREERAGIPAVLPGRWVGYDPVYDRDRIPS